MPINTSDISFSVIKETVAGTTPTTGTRLEAPIKADQAPLTAASTQIADDTKLANRTGNAPSTGHQTVEGSMNMAMRGGAFMDLMLESAVAGAFTGSSPAKATAGSNDVPFSVITTLKTGTAGNAMEYIDAGCMVRSLQFTANAKDGAEITFDIIGQKRTEATTNNALTVTRVPIANVRHLYSDVTVTVGSQTLDYSNIQFSIGHDRELRVVLGAQQAVGISTPGKRSTKGSMKVYRESFAVNALSNTLQQVTVTCSTGAGNGYKFVFPKAKIMTPTDELDNTGLLAMIEFEANSDPVSLTDVWIEKL